MANEAETKIEKWEDLKGIDPEEFKTRLANEEFDDLMIKSEDFRKAVNDGTLFTKSDDSPLPPVDTVLPKE